MRLVFDLEANGLYEEADTIWCIVAKDIDSNHIYNYDVIDMIILLESADLLVGHNIIDYDLRLLKKVFNDFNPKGKIFDTMILSQLLNPDRKGGHSLGQYGEELGIAKVENEDWSKFTPHMLHRCTEDVNINHKVYTQLIAEAYEDVEGIPYNNIFINQEWS